MVKNLPPNAGDVGSIPGMGRDPGEGNGNPLKCTYLGNPMDRGAWWATADRVSQRVGHKWSDWACMHHHWVFKKQENIALNL